VEITRGYVLIIAGRCKMKILERGEGSLSFLLPGALIPFLEILKDLVVE